MAAAQWIDAHTPTVTVTDPRGLDVRNVAYCRHPLNTSVDTRITRNHFDPAGRLFASWDPRLWGTAPKPNLENTFDLQGRALLVESVDAGWRLSLMNQADAICSFWDGRGSQRHTEYDELLRPVTVTEQMAGESARVSDRFAYADAGHGFAVHNQCGKLICHDHPAGSRRLCEYGVGGLLLSERMRFLRDLEPPNWSSAFADAGLEDEVFETTQLYGPLGDMRSQTDAMDNVRSFAYDRAGQLREARLKLVDSADEPRLLVSEIRYDALGRGISERAGNGVSTSTRYADEDGRLLQLQSCDADGQPLHDFNYAYDPMGNITSIEDKAQLTRHFNNQRIDPVCSYTYDSLYQLIEATGSEVSQPSYGPALPSWQTTPLDPSQLRNYIQTFNYDAAGNLQTRHHSGAETFEMFTSPDSNRSVADEGNLVDGFDANGNQLALLRSQKMSWDIRNQLSRVTLVRRGDGPDDSECYCYDSPGHRLRKVRLTQAASRTLRAEVRYLPGLEIHRDSATGEERHVVSVEAGRSQVRALHWVTKLPCDIPDNQLRFCLSNHLNSSTLELDEQGGVLSREHFYAFGGTALWAGASEIKAKYKTIRYSGKERDATGLYHYGYRYYAPWLQRWVNPDPAGNVDGNNYFLYVSNNPVTYMDSQGLMKRRPVFASMTLTIDADSIVAHSGVRFSKGKLMEHSEGANFFHGSDSSSLLMFTLDDPSYSGYLLPMGALLEQKIYPFGGEAGNALREGALNKEYISTVDLDNFGGAYNYSQLKSKEPWSFRSGGAELSAHIEDVTSREFDPKFHEAKQNLLQGRLERWNALEPGSRRLVDLGFPVVYGLSPVGDDEGRIKRVSSDVPGETAIRFGVSPEEIRVIYTEERYVELASEVVNKLVSARGISVKAFSEIRK
ncbi:insecticidal toxin complex protein TccC [Pseudomonas migulae]|uniref:RHS repeat domain-containing protein n=1 Tax=Pseudomonas migulae TaxID=78543 RepID=UPI0020A1027A|nr:RHS repeat-associated core domain-containing protein [Pseudomonas migulae]MCP1496823.1 insecticidal toxin complex protein TccC [Pseudomonas migulae]